MKNFRFFYNINVYWAKIQKFPVSFTSKIIYSVLNPHRMKFCIQNAFDWSLERMLVKVIWTDLWDVILKVIVLKHEFRSNSCILFLNIVDLYSAIFQAEQSLKPWIAKIFSTLWSINKWIYFLTTYCEILLMP